MDFALDEKTVDMRRRLLAFMEKFVYPAEGTFRDQAARAHEGSAASRWDTPPVIEELKAEARAQGLWNLFLPATHSYGAGLTNLQYAPLAEITGRSPWIAPEALNCSAPDTGNMELLSLFGTPEQQKRWLQPLLDGKIRSAFSMTEPAVASSDATNSGWSPLPAPTPLQFLDERHPGTRYQQIFKASGVYVFRRIWPTGQ